MVGAASSHARTARAPQRPSLATYGTPISTPRLFTQSIPIIFTRVTDPVSQGFVSSLARPGRNITGFADFPFSIGTKWLQLLKEVAPRIGQVALVYNPLNSVSPGFLRAVEGVLKSAGMNATELPIGSVNDFQRLAALGGKPGIGMITLPDPFTFAHRAELVKLAARHRLPAIYAVQGFTAAGGLISYAPSSVDPYRPAASYVDRILRGEKPADLPVQYPTKYELSINLKTAKALGLTIPPSLLIQADEVIR
jgi:putative ABC transport system substrate-binding protein